MRKIIKNILLLVNFTVAFALCTAYLANYVNPARIWVFAFFGLVYPYLLAINIIFIGFWIFRRNKWALLSVFVILTGFSNIWRFIQIDYHRTKPAPANSFKVLTYNVRLFNYFEWENQKWVHDSILSYIKSESPDILCMQDFFTRKNIDKLSEKQMKDWLKGTKYNHINYTYSFNSGNSNFGIATFSKYPIVDKGKIVFENSVNACIYSDVKIDNDTVRIYNVHLQSLRLNKNNYGIIDSIFSLNSKSMDDVKDLSLRMRKAYIQRAKQVKMITSHMEKSPFPVILCGDFNDTPLSYTYEQLLGERKDAYRESGFGSGKTYRGHLPSYRIDYIFYNDIFTSFNYKTDRVNLSDHFPVSCNLILKNN